MCVSFLNSSSKTYASTRFKYSASHYEFNISLLNKTDLSLESFSEIVDHLKYKSEKTVSNFDLFWKISLKSVASS